MFVALAALSGGVFDAVGLIRARRDSRLLGAVGYWLFDVATLYACLLAYGPAPSFWVVAMAYLVGMLANSLPIPAGLIAVEGGLFGDAAAVRSAPGLTGARRGRHLPGDLAVDPRADWLGRIPQPPPRVGPAGRARGRTSRASRVEARRRLLANATSAAAVWQACPGRRAIAR